MLFVFRGDSLIAFPMSHIMGETRLRLKVLSRDRICTIATDSGSFRCVFPQFKLHGRPRAQERARTPGYRPAEGGHLTGRCPILVQHQLRAGRHDKAAALNEEAEPHGFDSRLSAIVRIQLLKYLANMGFNSIDANTQVRTYLRI